MMMESLGSGLPNQKVVPFLVTLEPDKDVPSVPIVHLGEEWVYCLEGVVVYEVAGEQFRLQSGDSLLFRASLPHRWHNPGTQPALLILVLEISQDQDVAVEQHVG
jgi:quercetin dioxygenase-like cupin family protein